MASRPRDNPGSAARRVPAAGAAAARKGQGAAAMTYAGAGVDIEAGDRMVSMIEGHMRGTYGPRVLGQHGAFAGMLRLDYNERLFKRNYHDPVLVSCADGVGSKVLIARDLGIYHTVGRDLVAMNVNDMIVQGAEPLLFLDYIGTHKLSPQRMTRIVQGVAQGCERAGCALLGGETAELPDIYAPGDFDLAGFAVGVVELSKIIDGSRTEPGDVILGLGSSGVHSNGYTLVRAIVKRAKLKLDKAYPELAGGGSEGDSGDDRAGNTSGGAGETSGGGVTLGEALIEPTRIYARPIVSVLRGYKVKRPISAMAHITGGGLVGNVPRVLGSHLDARIHRAAWDVPPIFRFLQQRGKVANPEMFRVFNMGIGYVLVVRPHFAHAIAARLTRLGERVFRLGEITPGTGRVNLR